MKVTQDETVFCPITITLETKKEATDIFESLSNTGSGRDATDHLLLHLKHLLDIL